MKQVWLVGLCALAFVPSVRASQKETQKPVVKVSKLPKDNDDNFELCSRMLPDTLLYLIAHYCVGTKEDGVCPLLARAFCWNRVIAYCPEKGFDLDLSVLDDDPRFMMLGDYRRGLGRPTMNTFNFETGEHMVRNFLSAADIINTTRAAVLRNGICRHWDYIEDHEAGDMVFAKKIDHMLPDHQALTREECRIKAADCTGVITVGMAQGWRDSMSFALLRQDNGDLFVQWVFNTPSKVKLVPDTTKAPLSMQDKLWFLSSDDRGCLGIVFKHSVVLFDGTTGAELMRCTPPEGSFFPIEGRSENEGITLKIRPISVPSEQRTRYELIACTQKEGRLMYTEDNYMRWDIDEKRMVQDTCLRKGRTDTLAGRHILSSGAFVAMHVSGEGSQLKICDSRTNNTRLLWDKGWWSEFDNEKYQMYVTPSGSHAMFYGKSRGYAPDTSSSAFCITSLHFDPTVLCQLDVPGVNASSLLQRIQLLHGLCLAAYYDDTVTLTAKGRTLFSQLHSRVRCNLQTTMRKVYGWKEEPATRASRTPILPSFISAPVEKKERKRSDSTCKTQ